MAAALLLSAFLLFSVHALAVSEVASDDFKTTEDVASTSLYSKVSEPTLRPGHLEDLPGFTRSVVRKDHALITPESQVFASLPGWTNTQAAHFITPALGAHFQMLIARLAANASAAQPSSGVERFYFVVSGKATFKHGKKSHSLEADSFAYAPADKDHKLTTGTEEGATLVVIERIFSYSDSPNADKQPKFQVGKTEDKPVIPVEGEMFVLRKLLPQSIEYDFNIHVMDFQPGEYLNIKEVHYNQHGLLLLEGRGIYRLAENWYPVQAGDVIYMAPFVPQWYAALGKTRSRYLLYKDTNRDPLLAM